MPRCCVAAETHTARAGGRTLPRPAVGSAVCFDPLSWALTVHADGRVRSTSGATSSHAVESSVAVAFQDWVFPGLRCLSWAFVAAIPHQQRPADLTRRDWAWQISEACSLGRIRSELSLDRVSSQRFPHLFRGFDPQLCTDPNSSGTFLNLVFTVSIYGPRSAGFDCFRSGLDLTGPTPSLLFHGWLHGRNIWFVQGLC